MMSKEDLNNAKEAPDGATDDAPPLTPPRPPLFASKSPPMFATKSPPFSSPHALFQKMTLNDDDSATVDSSSGAGGAVAGSGATASKEDKQPPLQDGTRAHPYLTFLDLNTPERGRDFEATFVTLMHRAGWERPGIHIRRLVNNCDMEAWEAEIPGKEEHTEYAGRSILVRRPAFDHVQLKPKLYHSKIKKEDVFKAHTNYLLQGKLVDWVYHLVYFNENVVLDNSHFSGEKTNKVKTEYVPVKIGSHDNPFGKDLYFLYASWEIAFQDGGVKLGDADAGKVDKKKFFD